MNKITGITVSKNYSDYLEPCIKHNYDIFEKWYIVTQEDDLETIRLINDLSYPNIVLCYYPLVPELSKPDHKVMPFTGNDAKILYHEAGYRRFLIEQENLKTITPEFNPREKRYVSGNKVQFDKGGAIRYIQQFEIEDGENVLILDSDIIISDDLKEKVQNINLESNMLYGCFRRNFKTYNELINGAKGDDYFRNGFPDGFFQLYKSDKRYKYPRSINASGCDAHFGLQFQDRYQINWKHIRSTIFTEYCYHLGEDDRRNWRGRVKNN